MTDDTYQITQQNLDSLGITPQEIEEAGGMEALVHIIWFLKQSDNHIEMTFDDAIEQAIKKKQEEDILLKSFDNNFDEQDVSDEESKDNIMYLQHVFPDSMVDIKEQDTCTIKQMYQKNWGTKPQPILKLLIEAYFLETQDLIVCDDIDKKEILKTVRLLRSHVAGQKLPLDAEDEHLIIYAQFMYQEFLESKQDYNHCPIFFLLDSYYDSFPEKYRMIVKSLPVTAILRIFADMCFYDSETHIIEEPLPEEVNIKNLCEMIEKLARILKIWQ